MNRFLTPEQLEFIERRTDAEHEAQGLPLICEDPGVLAKTARIVAAAMRSKREAS